MATRRRSVTSAVFGGLLLVGASSCSSSPPGPAPLDRATAAVLADAADRLAEALAEDDTCRATLEADALRERAARALEEGDAPESVVAETTRVADVATAGLACDPEDDDAGDLVAAEEEEERAVEEAAEAVEEAAEATEADSGAATTEPAPTSDASDSDPAPAPAPAPAEDVEVQDDGPQGKAKGHDRGGGPPSDRGQGRGNR